MRRILFLAAAALLLPTTMRADKLEIITDVEGQPLGQNVLRLLQALDFLGHPLAKDQAEALETTAKAKDVKRIQELLDPHVALAVSINPESRVKVACGPAEAVIQQHGFTPLIIKVVNDSTVKKGLQIHSPQAGPRQKQDYNRTIAEFKRKIKDKQISVEDGEREIAKLQKENDEFKNRFLQLQMFTARPLTDALS